MIHVEPEPFRPPRRSFTEIDRDEIVRQTLTEVETRLQRMNVNKLYGTAFRLAIKVIRSMKP